MPAIDSPTAPPAAPRRSAGAPRGHRRRSAVPPAPAQRRRELDVLDECEGEVGFHLWRALSDVLLWAEAPAASRATVLAPGAAPHGMVAEALSDAEEVAGPLGTLLDLRDAAPAGVGEACAAIAAWAEQRGMRESALQFAEAAARVEPERAAWAWAAGRLCRRMGELERAKGWLRRSVRLSRLAGDEVQFANAHRHLGVLLLEEGRFREAEPHCWKCVRAALRHGRRSLAGAGYHNLLVVAVHLQDWDAAAEHARQAVELYPAGYPGLPELAHDVAYYWCRRGYYSCGLPIFEEVIPLIDRPVDRIAAYASLARSAAVVRDSVRYHRASERVRELAREDTERTASSLYHVGEGARCFGRWEEAEALGREALRLAGERGNATVVALARELLASAARRVPGPHDVVPEENGIVDRSLRTLRRKLDRHRRHRPTSRDPLAADRLSVRL